MTPIRGRTACLLCVFLLNPYFSAQKIKVLCVPFRHPPTPLPAHKRLEGHPLSAPPKGAIIQWLSLTAF